MGNTTTVIFSSGNPIGKMVINGLETNQGLNINECLKFITDSISSNTGVLSCSNTQTNIIYKFESNNTTISLEFNTNEKDLYNEYIVSLNSLLKTTKVTYTLAPNSNDEVIREEKGKIVIINTNELLRIIDSKVKQNMIIEINQTNDLTALNYNFICTDNVNLNIVVPSNVINLHKSFLDKLKYLVDSFNNSSSITQPIINETVSESLPTMNNAGISSDIYMNKPTEQNFQGSGQKQPFIFTNKANNHVSGIPTPTTGNESFNSIFGNQSQNTNQTTNVTNTNQQLNINQTPNVNQTFNVNKAHTTNTKNTSALRNIMSRSIALITFQNIHTAIIKREQI